VAAPIRRKPKREALPEVDPNEWDYSGCPHNQLVYCYLYTLTRLICRERIPQLESGVEKLRLKANDPTSFDSLQKVAFDLAGPGSGTWRLLVAFPEWPRLPWLAIPETERERRLKTLFSDYYPTHSESSAKDILPARLPKDLVTRLDTAMKAYGLPVIPIGSGCWSVAEVDLMKLQGKEIDWSRLELAPRETPQSFLAVLVLHWQRSDPDLLVSVSNLLKLIRPPNIPQDKRSTPKETAQSQSRYDLKALGAWFLLKQTRWDWKKAAQVSLEHLEKSLFVEQSAWIDAGKRAEKLMQEFGGLKPV
jgi:hypothetical protein